MNPWASHMNPRARIDHSQPSMAFYEAIGHIERQAHIAKRGDLPGREYALTLWSDGYGAWIEGDPSYSAAEARERLRLWRQDRLCEALGIGPLADHAIPGGRWWEPVLRQWSRWFAGIDAAARQAWVDKITLED